MVLERLVEPFLRKSQVHTLITTAVPASATQPDGTRSKLILWATTEETRQKSLSAVVAKPSGRTHWPGTRPSVVKSKVDDVRPLPPAVTAAMSPETPAKPTWR